MIFIHSLCRFAALQVFYNDFYSLFMPLRGSASFYNYFYSIFRPLRGYASCFIKIFIHSLCRFAALHVFIMIFIHNKIPPLVLYFIIYNLYNIFFLINKDINIFIYYIFLENQIYKRYYINLYVKLFMPLRGSASFYNDFYSICMPLRGSASFL
jgi:hypothetical protein